MLTRNVYVVINEAIKITNLQSTFGKKQTDPLFLSKYKMLRRQAELKRENTQNEKRDVTDICFVYL